MKHTPESVRVWISRLQNIPCGRAECGGPLCELCRGLEPVLSDLLAENERMREALTEIAAIEDELTGGDWEEIEKARTIARAALTPESKE